MNASPVPARRPPLRRPPLRRALAMAGGAVLTLLCFLVLPLIQAITAPPDDDTLLRGIDTTALPPPPPPPPPEPEKPPEAEPEPPAMDEPPPQFDFGSLDLVLDGGGGGSGFLPGDLGGRVAAAQRGSEDGGVFGLADLDQKPRPVHQPGPNWDAVLRAKAPGHVQVLFVVDEDGRVAKATVQSSTDTVFEPAALAAVRKWRFEPGRSQGRPVRFRMRVQVSFPKQ